MRPLEGQLVASARFSVTQSRWLPSIAERGDERLVERRTWGGLARNEKGRGGKGYEQPMVINDTHQ